MFCFSSFLFLPLSLSLSVSCSAQNRNIQPHALTNKGNGVVKKIKHYRKRVINRYKSLTYLDDRPVFEDDRRRAEAFMAALEKNDGDVKMAR